MTGAFLSFGRQCYGQGGRPRGLMPELRGLRWQLHQMMACRSGKLA